MQIVQDLGGYTLGRADLVRRAMSKKKQKVMEEERRNFVYGNEEQGVPGCIKNGIDEATANKIYDEMIDFANYAFNKSHAAAYALVSYQTAWLKYYYPVEYMAALMTSVIDNPGKCAEYIMTARSMGISILPPDINDGENGFSVSRRDGKLCIRYALAAIKAVGHPVISAIIEERRRGGTFRDIRDFADRLSGQVNKRAAENFIKAGAFDSLGGTRRQMMMVAPQVFDAAAQEKKSQISGQMSLFDLLGEEDRKNAGIRMPDVGEYDKQTRLSFEKEVLGIYVSGHPLEEYEDLWKKNISAFSSDFQINEESGQADRLPDQSKQTIGGILSASTIKYTKTNKTMAFLTIEDLVGSVEVLVFPRDYEKYKDLFTADAKLFVRGRVTAEDDKPSKLIAESVIPFDQVPGELWVRFPNVDAFTSRQQTLKDLLEGRADSNEADGEADAPLLGRVMIYVESPKLMKQFYFRGPVRYTHALSARLSAEFGEKNCVYSVGKLR